MAFAKLQFRPTILQQGTSYSAEGFWRDCNRIRFRYGFPETIGGWQTLGETPFLGTCRSLFAWNTLSGAGLMGVGTSKKFYVERGTLLFDITPLRLTSTLNNVLVSVTSTLVADLTADAMELTVADAANFPVQGTVRIGTEVIQYLGKQGDVLTNLVRADPQLHASGALVATRFLRVNDPMAMPVLGDFLTITNATAVGGIPAGSINVESTVHETQDTYFFIETNAFATSSATGGGSITIKYQEYTGADLFTRGGGWGGSPWSVGTWGDPNGTLPLAFQMRIWNQKNFGEDLIFGPRGGALYYWTPINNALVLEGESTRAIPLSDFAGAEDVPVVHNALLITETRFTMVFGTNPIGSMDMDPMLIRWSDIELPQKWTPTPTNLAGDIRLSVGSEIITAVQTRQEILVWTNQALYSIQFSDGFGFTQSLLADNVSIAGPNAVVVSNSNVYWMGVDKFYIYTGRTDTLPSSVESYVFSRINNDQLPQVYAATNEAFDEVWWFYPSDQGNGATDSYVVYNYVENSWYYGSMNRTAWLDSGVRPKPVAVGNNRIYFHETGVDDGDTVPSSPMGAFIESADFDIGEGDKFMFTRRMLPDVSFLGSLNLMPSLEVTLKVRRSTGAPYATESAHADVYKVMNGTVETFTQYLYFRARGRQAKVRFESNTIGTSWRLGFSRLDIQPDGGRS